MKFIKKIRNSKNQPVGYIVADKTVYFRENQKPSTTLVVGWSLCHKKDKWDQEVGKKLAFKRYLFARDFCIPFTEKTPKDVLKSIPSIVERAKKYYKLNDFDEILIG